MSVGSMRITRALVTMPNMAPPMRPPKAQALPERKRRLRNEPLKIPSSRGVGEAVHRTAQCHPREASRRRFPAPDERLQQGREP